MERIVRVDLYDGPGDGEVTIKAYSGGHGADMALGIRYANYAEDHLEQGVKHLAEMVMKANGWMFGKAGFFRNIGGGEDGTDA
jgi:hypothetical protein